MRYDEFFRNFYIGESDGHLTGCYTTWAIPKFFVDTVIRQEEHRKKLPTDDFSYDKWFQGSSSPRNHWSNFCKEYNEDDFVAALDSAIDKTHVVELLEKFGVESTENESVNTELLFTAIARQFEALIDGRGEADDIVPSIYNSRNLKNEFLTYLDKAEKRYNVMKLIGGNEVPLEQFYVSNTIGKDERVFAEKKKKSGAYLDEPTMQSIRDMFKKQGYDNVRTLLIGSGGCGKSLMMQHLFLQSAKEYPSTGVLPIFLELRHFSQSNDLYTYMVQTVHDMDDTFGDAEAKSLLLAGKCQIFLDGFDEIDPTDIDHFLLSLKDFVSDYEETQIIITSRQNEALTGISQFMKLYIWPFETEQSIRLIDKILNYQGDIGSRDAVLDYINNGFLKKDGIFASHPLLLTFVAMKYPSFNRFYDDPSLFYKVTYEALLSGHDENKRPYDRVFKSVDNAVQFSEVFTEFCALTYKDAVFQLDSRKFEEYFNRLVSYKSFESTHKMDIKNFKHDVCSTACIMYEKEYDLYYIDPGFQECLFAEYYYHADDEAMKDLVQSLGNISFAKLERFEALDMLKRLSPEKFKYKVLLPYLEKVFRTKNDDESFNRFLQYCFSEVKVVNINDAVMFLFLKKLDITKTLTIREENYPRSILMNYILRDMGEDVDYYFSLYSKDVAVENGEVVCFQMPDDINVSGMVIGQDTSIEGERCLLIDCKPMDVYELFQKNHKDGSQQDYLVDENNDLVLFGMRITLEGYYLETEADKYAELLTNISHNSTDSYSMFLRMKEYCNRLKVEKYKSGLR